MRKLIHHIMLVLVAMSSTLALADTPNDSIYIFFYKNWEQMLNMEPVAMIVNPLFDVESPYEVYFVTGDDNVDERIKEDFIAFSLNDTSWYLNSRYIKRCFKGDVKHVHGYVPLYFNEKTAFVISTGPVTVKDVLFGSGPDGVTTSPIDYYYLDFLNKRLERVTPDYLSTLLDNYRDLLMRYEGTKDHKKLYVIEDYFFKFIDRYTDDLMTPFIVDIVDYTHLQ